MKKRVLIGVGNILFADDGAGVYAADYLQRNYRCEPAIDIVDGGVLGLNLMRYFLEYDEIIILDTLSVDEVAGSIYHLPSDALLGLGNSRKTVHEIEVIQMIEIGLLMGSTTAVSVVGIVPEDLQSVRMDLSPCLKKQFDRWIETVIETLRQKGVSFVPNDTIVTLDEVIASYHHQTLRAG